MSSNGNAAYREWDGVPVIPVDVQKNAEQRLACVLLVDCSGSMHVDNQIEQVNEGLKKLEAALKNDALASVRTVVSVIAFGTDSDSGVEIVQEWTDAIDFVAPSFTAIGSHTPMGAAVNKGLDAIEEIQTHLRSNGVSLYRPWMFLLTDGQPSDDYLAAAKRCAQAVSDKKLILWPITTNPDSAAPLQSFIGEQGKIYAVNTTNIRELFVWLSQSIKLASTSNPGQKAQVNQPGGVVTFDL
jgi:uncharacterized protein YegL